MLTLFNRTYSGEKDLQAMLDLLIAARPPERVTDYPSLVDLQELLATREVQENTRLWLDVHDNLLGYAFVDHYHNLRFEIHPQITGPVIESQMVNWGVECIRRAVREGGEPLTLDASCREDNTRQIEILERNGFVRQGERSLHLTRSLDEPIPTPQIPTGFSLRHVLGEQEVEALVALHRAAFGTEHMTVEERLAMMHVPEYDPQLDLLAVAPDGRLAAYCFCSISEQENRHSGRKEGWTDPVATHPDFQRRGLAKALLLRGLQKLKERGMQMALIGTSGENLAMQKAAQAVGFQVKSTTVWFAKSVEE